MSKIEKAKLVDKLPKSVLIRVDDDGSIEGSDFHTDPDGMCVDMGEVIAEYTLKTVGRVGILPS